MTNAEKFYKSFGMYATELWAMPEEKFLKWLNYEQKKANADRIRAMTDEELADFLDSIVQDWHQGTAQIGDRIIDSWLDWLKEEA